MSLSELALAYELRQEGCCWKRIALGLGTDSKLIAAQVSYLVRNGITKGMNGYKRQGGRQSAFDIRLVKAANGLRQCGKSWAEVGHALGVDHERLRRANRYANSKGLI